MFGWLEECLYNWCDCGEDVAGDVEEQSTYLRTKSDEDRAYGAVETAPESQRLVRRQHPELFDKTFEIRELIGCGSSSKCYKCVRRRDGKEFAVKIINFATLSLQYPQKALKRLYREVRSLQALDHENIVKLEESHSSGDQLYIVEEYLGGGELYDRIVEMNGLTEDHARCIFFQIASAVNHMHKRNIMHRDIKPENVLLTDAESLKVKLIDFGFSKTLHGTSHATSFLGTGGFLAPELRLSSGGDTKENPMYTKAVDIWALGCLLYIMICARMPFDDTLYARPKSDFKVKFGPGRQWNYVSDELKSLLVSMLQPEPLRRLTIGEVLNHPWLHPIKKVIRKKSVSTLSPSTSVTSFGSIGESGRRTPFFVDSDDQKAPDDSDEDSTEGFSFAGEVQTVNDTASPTARGLLKWLSARE